MPENNVINIRLVMAEHTELNISPEAIDEMREFITHYIIAKATELEYLAKEGYDNRTPGKQGDKMRTIKKRHFRYGEMDNTQGIPQLEAAVKRLMTKKCDNCSEALEVLKLNQLFIEAIETQFPDLASDERVDMLGNTNKSLLKKMGEMEVDL